MSLQSFNVEIVPESEWESLFEEVIKHKGTAIILGATDSGKSTLIKYLIKRILSKNIKVSLVDSDVGQSSLGLPGTITMKVFSDEKDLEDFRFERMFFVGAINPATKIPQIINGTKRMSDICRERSDITLIDTSGLISGEVGIAFKLSKIKAINPEHVIAVQWHGELEHILGPIETLNIYRIRTPAAAKIRSIATRTLYRKKKFNNYFSKDGTAEFLLYTNEAIFFYKDKPFSPKGGEFKGGTLIGLNHEEDTVALGIVVEITDASITFESPIKSISKINRVVFGDIII